MAEFEFTSVIPGDAAQFLAAFDLRAVNRELGPLLSMTAPGAFAGVPILRWQSGERLFSSWVLLLGIFPLDRHHFRLEALDPDTGFRERSSSWLNREWNHDRRVTDVDGGIQVSDRVSVISRIPGLDTLLLPVYRAVFAHRHRRLRKQHAAARSV